MACSIEARFHEVLLCQSMLPQLCIISRRRRSQDIKVGMHFLAMEQLKGNGIRCGPVNLQEIRHCCFPWC